ncbi:MAG: L-serine ammonia-lyase, iron-sulfur-dependent, subunit alpha [Bacillota bacterium]|nr:L-serine ammonia-lyase, iron-sulfur-dependent, subunit alpha [Bacillota bacterium]HHT89779.1 L-serine ammonia-lyase, iron-sulfur-dependent, subunit alpha [Bacillota bacterium]
MEITSATQLLQLCSERDFDLAQAVAEYEAFRANTTCDAVRESMRDTLGVMRASVESGREDQGERAHLIKGYGRIYSSAKDQGHTLGGSLFQHAILYALSVAQYNAGLGRIVACPTAGACGVVPGALLAVADELQSSEEELIDALLVMGGVGIVSAAQGPISGAEGGCQSECGVASAMAAGAIVHLMGGSPQQVFDAASLALQSHLGLVCDPLASLVEVPCVTRNATSATTAIVAANMALAGIPGVIPYDETVVAMRKIGKAMPESLRETSQGGLAATPTGLRLYGEMREKYRL